jgi:2',3'-cyclic-nucleotide 2'-phosphodiesterase / 3'-nucleotidase / 5'-nucleotidase
MRLSRSLLPVLVLTLALARPASAEDLRLTVLHTTDLHGALTAFDYLADRPAARGLAKVATLVRQVRSERGQVLLLDAGDCIQGSALELTYRAREHALPEPMMAAMNEIGYDAMAVGNHEFDFGLEALEQARGEAKFPWLAANIVRDDGQPAFGTSLVKRYGDVTVGVVGICTPAVPSMVDSVKIAGLRFESPVEVARREVARLRGTEHCDVVVVLAHSGLGAGPDEDSAEAPDENWGRRLAQDVPGIDLVVLGHTHVVVPSVEVNGVLETQAGKWGEGLGRVDLTLTRGTPSERWHLTSRVARVLAVADSTVEDEAIVKLAAPYHTAAEVALAEVIGHAAKPFDSPHGRLADGSVWDFIHAVQLDATGADVSLSPLFEPPARIAAGPITLRDALRIYPYDNTLGVVELTGQELAETLERAAAYFQTYTYEADRPLSLPGWPGFHFDVAQGVSYEIDLTQPVGHRVINLVYQGQPLAADRRLKVAVSNYRLNGGGGYTAVQRAPRLLRTQKTVRELIIDYLHRHDPATPSSDQNWELLPDYAAANERPLIDRLVREGVAPRNEVLRLGPDLPAYRGDVAYWLARAFGWRERKPSGAFSDVPDSLEPWLDGLLKRKIIGESATKEEFRPFATVPVGLAIDWSDAAARRAGYALANPVDDREFRLSLLTGVGEPRLHSADGTAVFRDSLSRAEALGLIANTRYPTIRVLGTTDFHGAILTGGRDRRSGRMVGGSAVLAAYVARLRAENPYGTVLVDDGDWYQGTMISNLQFGRPVIEQMNALRYAAAVIGNHEFDWSADTLIRRIQELHCAALGANVRERKTNKAPRWAKADTLVVRRGVRVGILGLCYPNTPSVTLPRYVAHLRFEDDSSTAARLVPVLRRKGLADVVLTIGHIPGTTDSTGRIGGDLGRLARGVPGVDLWLGGHSHNQLSGAVNGVPAMIAGSHGEVIATCDLVVDPVGNRVIERHYRLVPTFADDIRPDSVMAARVAHWNAGVATEAAKPVGVNARRLTRNRNGESPVGDLVTDAMRAATGVDIALQNNGGLRADLPEGTITQGGVYEVMPFDNTIVTLELTANEVKLALEEALRYQRVTQVSGVRYEFDYGRPPFDRVVGLTLGDGAPLDSTRTYRVAVNNFMAEGGDDYSVLRRGANRVDTGLTVRESLESHIRRLCEGGAPLEIRDPGRVTRKPGSQAGSRED